MKSILVIDDEPQVLKFFSDLFSFQNYRILGVRSASEGLNLLRQERPELVFCDIMLADQSGLDVLVKIREFDSELPVIVMTGSSSTEIAIRAMSLGANDYLCKPLNPLQLRKLAQEILQFPKSTPEFRLPQSSSDQQMVGQSPIMYEVFKLIGRVAPQSCRVLILGESGTGKELVARAIHDFSPRHPAPFVAINCAAIPESLLESELFGHEKGSFTGAERQRVGLIEKAENGTLFLDEIGDLPLAIQAKLLRVLQEQVFYRIGGEDPIPTTARVMAATNKLLDQEILSGKFREDLYHRLANVLLKLPPLRERPGDIGLLANHFLQRSAAALNRPNLEFTPEVLRQLEEFPWPGNVRQLANVVHQAAMLTSGPVVTQLQMTTAPLPTTNASTSPSTSFYHEQRLREYITQSIATGSRTILSDLVNDLERFVLNEVLVACDNNMSLAATHLGIHRVTLKSKRSPVANAPARRE